MKSLRRRRIVVDNSALARSIGERIRAARLSAGLTQQQLAEGRYSKAYVSALEKGHAKPSLAALTFFSERLGLAPSHFVGHDETRWSRLSADLLLASGRWRDALDAYAGLLDEPMDRASRAEVLRAQAEALCRLGRGMDAVDPAAEAMTAFRELRRDADAVLAGYWLANALYLVENTAEARSVLRTLLDQVRGGLQVEPDLALRLLTALSYVETWDGNYAAAVSYLEEARALSADIDDRRRAAYYAALAAAYLDSGDFEAAIRTGHQGLALYRAAEAEREAALVENNLANAYLGLGNLSRAAELAAEAHREHERLGDDHELATVLDTEARIRLAGGDVEGALKLASRAIDAARASTNRKALADASVTMARVSVKAGQAAQAVAYYEEAAALLREHGPQARLAEMLSEWADTVAQMGDHEAAYTLTRRALEAIRQY